MHKFVNPGSPLLDILHKYFASGYPSLQEPQPKPSRLYFDRVARRHCNHHHPCGNAPARAVQVQNQGARHLLSEQPPPTKPGLVHVYPEDNNEKLVPNGTGDQRGWIEGWLLTPQDATNVNLIKAPKGLLWNYNQSLEIYKCPADKSAVKLGGRMIPRVRSISMNGNMNGDSWYTAEIKNTHYTFKKTSEIINPSPSQAFVFLDEHPDGIDDGYFLVFVNRKQTWGNLPANYHNSAWGFSFADGHAEIRKWKDPDSLSRKIVANAKGPTDVPWIQVRTSAPIKDGTPWPP